MSLNRVVLPLYFCFAFPWLTLWHSNITMTVYALLCHKCRKSNIMSLSLLFKPQGSQTHEPFRDNIQFSFLIFWQQQPEPINKWMLSTWFSTALCTTRISHTHTHTLIAFSHLNQSFRKSDFQVLVNMKQLFRGPTEAKWHFTAISACSLQQTFTTRPLQLTPTKRRTKCFRLNFCSEYFWH